MVSTSTVSIRGRACSSQESRTACTFPLTGEGIGKAMQMGMLAAEQALAALQTSNQSPIGAYRARLEAELLPSYRGYALAEKWLRRPWLYDLLVSRIEQSVHMRALATGVIVGTSHPDQLFSIANLVKSLWLGALKTASIAQREDAPAESIVTDEARLLICAHVPVRHLHEGIRKVNRMRFVLVANAGTEDVSAIRRHRRSKSLVRHRRSGVEISRAIRHTLTVSPLGAGPHADRVMPI